LLNGGEGKFEGCNMTTSDPFSGKFPLAGSSGRKKAEGGGKRLAVAFKEDDESVTKFHFLAKRPGKTKESSSPLVKKPRRKVWKGEAWGRFFSPKPQNLLPKLSQKNLLGL